MKKDYSLKNRYNLSSAKLVGDLVEGYPTQEYVNSLQDRLDGLEYKQRLLLMTENFHSLNPFSFPETMDKIVFSLPSALPTDAGTVVKYIHISVIVKYVELYGLNYPELSLSCMEELTKRNTCEHAVRPFLANYYEMTYSQVLQWAENDNFHVRRLASESLRPFLPWSPVFKPYVNDPSPIVPVLDKLYNDSSLYVRRSVANNVNDISKISSDLALSSCQKWLKENDSDAVKYVVNHGLRTLYKQRAQ